MCGGKCGSVWENVDECGGTWKCVGECGSLECGRMLWLSVCGGTDESATY